MSQITTHLRNITANCLYLVLSRAPLAVLWHYLLGLSQFKQRQHYHVAREKFRSLMASKTFSNDWFTNNIPYWLPLFEAQRLLSKPLKMLEVGSWEGGSSLYLLTAFPQAHLTCVDTWQGADEHKGSALVKSTESHFDSNLAEVSSRLTKFKGTSYQFFGSHPATERFDVIYIDGSHHGDDVMNDALKALQLLKPGGLLIFDDYLWREYADWRNNPAPAINAFLRLKAKQVKVIAAYYQLIVQKTTDADNTVKAVS